MKSNQCFLRQSSTCLCSFPLCTVRLSQSSTCTRSFPMCHVRLSQSSTCTVSFPLYRLPSMVECILCMCSFICATRSSVHHPLSLLSTCSFSFRQCRVLSTCTCSFPQCRGRWSRPACSYSSIEAYNQFLLASLSQI